ncbi:uncharacterized protein PgNI_01299 [Pyricularia grisea]|uniref:Uncharacterized protein n=1 Tax=Pyricularia grisea TaxID=148305 RepID=A0A6P8BGX6_PYRGI|nr:uncharacterized protein PgNI_01299 [Pyricularia grisea]TLD15874.1 hypothetical protein PgNI_01299 [Pyricularia grisea]
MIATAAAAAAVAEGSRSASPVGSVVFSSVSLLVVSLLVLLLLRYYLPLRTTPAYLLVPVFFAIWLPACIVLLVPIDLASSAATDDEASRGIWLPDRLLLVSWRITYWLTFVLTWFILPVLGEYSDAGYREPKDRLIYSLHQNAQYYAIVFGSGLVGLVYVIWSYGMKLDSLKSLVMALAYFWGLALAIYLMGHGLVAIPRSLLRSLSISGQLRRIQTRAPKIYERMEDAEADLADLEAQVTELAKRAKTGSARDFQDWIEELVELACLPDGIPAQITSTRASLSSRALPTVITQKYMADLTRQLVRARHARSRYVSEWNYLLQEARETQIILDSAASKKLDFGTATPGAGFWDRITIFTPHTRYIYYYYALPYAKACLGGVLGLASACIIWSEMIKLAFPSLSLIRLSVVHHWITDAEGKPVGQVGFAGQMAASFWILYMMAAAFISITEVKVWRGRALVRRNTAHESAFWYASQVARLSVPLSYNFVTFMSPEVYIRTIFFKFLGQLINLTPLGKWFDYLFPVLVLIPVCATLFGLYGKIKRMFGFGIDIVGDEGDDDGMAGYGTGSWREGRDLIERELNGTSIRHRLRGTDGGGTGGRAAPILSIPGARGGNNGSRSPSTTPFATSPNGAFASSSGAGAGSSRRALGRGALPDEDPEDDNFFTALGHRMKNTIDSIDTPKWLQEIGDGIKKPKWMGGDDDTANNGSGSGEGPDFRRWFGGDGRIRL